MYSIESRIDLAKRATVSVVLHEIGARVPGADRLLGNRLDIVPGQHLGIAAGAHLGRPGIEAGGGIDLFRLERIGMASEREFQKSHLREIDAVLLEHGLRWRRDIGCADWRVAIFLPASCDTSVMPESLSTSSRRNPALRLRGLILRDQHEIEAALVGVHGGARDRQHDVDVAAALRRDRLVAAAELRSPRRRGRCVVKMPVFSATSTLVSEAILRLPTRSFRPCANAPGRDASAAALASRFIAKSYLSRCHRSARCRHGRHAAPRSLHCRCGTASPQRRGRYA